MCFAEGLPGPGWPISTSALKAGYIHPHFTPMELFSLPVLVDCLDSELATAYAGKQSRM